MAHELVEVARVHRRSQFVDIVTTILAGLQSLLKSQHLEHLLLNLALIVKLPQLMVEVLIVVVKRVVIATPFGASHQFKS